MRVEKNSKVAIVYDRVNKWGGAEKVLLVLNELFPQADLFTSIYNPKKAQWAKKFSSVQTSLLQKVPFFVNRHQWLGTFMPLAFENFDFSKYALVISVTSEAAKGIITMPSTKHICYMLTPTRYLWSHYGEYFSNTLFRLFTKPIVGYLRLWDKIAAQRPDKIIAISNEVKDRIGKYYQRDSIVIYPPVETFNLKTIQKKGNYFVVVSRLEKYKKVDLVIDAFNRMGRKLVVVGTGSEERKLRLRAKANIEFSGFVDEKKLYSYYRGARALIMPQREDFGIVSIEAQALGIPVIAYGKGGSKETVIPDVTGLLFGKQTATAIVDAVKRFDKMSFNTQSLKDNAKKYSKDVFIKKFRQEITNL